MSASSIPSPYVCDTLPPPRLASASSSRSPSPSLPLTPPVTAFDAPILDNSSLPMEPSKSEAIAQEKGSSGQLQQPPARKLCVRHQRMADEGTNLKLQQALDALPVQERQAVNAVWSNFSSSPHPRRALILQGLLTMCCFSQLSLLTEQLSHLIRIDPFTVLPREVSLKILGYLDATSLCRAAQVSRQWKSLADDDLLWRGICEQHIGQKCLKCGWGLPILEKRRAVRLPSSSASPCPSPAGHSLPPLHHKRAYDEAESSSGPSSKRMRIDAIDSRTDSLPPASLSPDSDSSRPVTPTNPLIIPNRSQISTSDSFTRPWKDVYCERLTIERNWRRGRCTVRTLKGHTDGVMCLQFSETLTHPSFPVLITGSYDRTARVWNLETGVEVHCLTGHTRAVRALQFDECKLITGSMDHTMRVWNWRTGKCLSVLEGHTEGVVCLNFDVHVLASGSVDTTIKVWNFRTGECFTLRGHCDWVNAVQLWDSNATSSCSSSVAVVDSGLSGSKSPDPQASPNIEPGKMLFSASDDGTIRLWDLSLRTCVRLFKGHVGQVQSLKLLLVDEPSEDDPDEDEDAADNQRSNNGDLHSMPAGLPDHPADALPAFLPPGYPAYATTAFVPPPGFDPYAHYSALSVQPTPQAYVHPDPVERDQLSGKKGKEKTSNAASSNKRQKPVLISGSLDNTIKLWDIDSGKAVKTLFGHIEGVWAIASDKLRLVSGSHDRTIKVWVREEGRCMATLVGHRGAVTCLALGEDKIVSGSDDGDIRLWSFSG
ncbi:putative E3 ubiquitin ligase complex SCF subunit sconB [Grifola frondosa]|uniref:Putative E3 ubiquitin ligase complex SCF subunit sconB n=1 Tax=Grifola frondosa TaxID=5627 RepID=A0A1C7MEL1_GRIFR|nr:putative E3 ubiquitin ligase complex SCF subunit sconB [Grifola frondosa]